MTEHQSTPERHRIDATGFSTAYADLDGMVCMDLWPKEKEVDGPARYSMTPGQALLMIQKLADAAQRALKGTVG